MATAATGRMTCAKCGANNFETQAACWKCGTPLGSGSREQGAGNREPGFAPVAPLSFAPPLPNVDPSVANWVGIVGGLLVPIAMLPVGLAFLMWDDRRKVEVGRIATIASLVGTLFHAVFTYFAVAGAVGAAMKMMPGAGGAPKSTQSEPAPDFNSEVEPPVIPGIPSLSPGRN